MYKVVNGTACSHGVVELWRCKKEREREVDVKDMGKEKIRWRENIMSAHRAVKHAGGGETHTCRGFGKDNKCTVLRWTCKVLDWLSYHRRTWLRGSATKQSRYPWMRDGSSKTDRNDCHRRQREHFNEVDVAIRTCFCLFVNAVGEMTPVLPTCAVML